MKASRGSRLQISLASMQRLPSRGLRPTPAQVPALLLSNRWDFGATRTKWGILLACWRKRAGKLGCPVCQRGVSLGLLANHHFWRGPHPPISTGVLIRGSKAIWRISLLRHRFGGEHTDQHPIPIPKRGCQKHPSPASGQTPLKMLDPPFCRLGAQKSSLFLWFGGPGLEIRARCFEV